ncbi:hypothetical protein CEE37_07150 [candidate division LCP-89 bacterium B3_LCP]|uniref:Secretion system C-terminal sorting domain-containing protein n=1 Tax=candidate division LCP-89 bacterium B3_LCP TaxID=2012998 RepID=A0A532V0J6_UNCL8|nr:MAG: hypothetical protein CEE37_07150 [candidate division LCP-89 bacterium B3_LCP]
MKHLNSLTGFCAFILLLSNLTIAQVHISGNLAGVLEDTSYVVDGDIYVLEADSLVIEPGAEFYFSGDYEFEINGYLYCVGTDNDSIIFVPDTGVPYWGGICFEVNSSDSNRLSYVLVTGGYADGNWPYYSGGGILCYACSPTISNSTITGNYATMSGGGIALYDDYDGSVVIRDCRIWENEAGYSGGGIVVYNTTSPLLENLDIQGNIAGQFGGGIENGDASPDIINCNISKNYCGLGGGGFHSWTDWGTYMQDCYLSENITDGTGGGVLLDFKVYNVHIQNCTVVRNEAEQGGGIAFGPDGDDLTVDHCLIEDNHAELFGGGMICLGADGSVYNCTFTNNTADSLGGAYYSDWELHSLPFYNNIVYGNSDGMYFERTALDSVLYCDFYDNPGGNFLGVIPANIGILSTTNLNGDSCDVYSNIYLDPLFVDPSSGDYHLQGSSPCIDAGDPLSPYDPDNTIADMGVFYYDQTTGIEKKTDIGSPEVFILHPAYPNPFNPSTTLNFTLPTASHLNLSIYNIQGRLLTTLVDGFRDAGAHEVTFKAADIPSGIYFAIMEIGDYHSVQKLVLLK